MTYRISGVFKNMSRAAAGLALLTLPMVGLAGPITGGVELGKPIIGGKMIVGKDGDVTATFAGKDAAYSGSLFVYSPTGKSMVFSSSAAVGTTVNIGTFAAGTELVFGYTVHDTGHTFLTGPKSANADGAEHAKAVTTYDSALDQYMTMVGMEDLWGGGDMDYNDFQFLLSNVIDPLDTLAVPGALASVPEPGPIALLGIGALMFGWMGRRARKTR